MCPVKIPSLPPTYSVVWWWEWGKDALPPSILPPPTGNGADPPFTSYNTWENRSCTSSGQPSRTDPVGGGEEESTLKLWAWESYPHYSSVMCQWGQGRDTPPYTSLPPTDEGDGAPSHLPPIALCLSHGGEGEGKMPFSRPPTSCSGQENWPSPLPVVALGKVGPAL